MKLRGRPRTSLRAICDALFHLAKAGCPWRRLPQTFPPWKTVCHFFHRWSRNGLLGKLNSQLRARTRKAQDKRTRPTACVLDSQTVRSNPHGGEVGYLATGLTVNGPFVSAIDRNVKEDSGPMAQDSRAAFGLGEDDKHIATVDAAGVALAAIQELNLKLEEKEKETRIQTMEKELAALKEIVTKLSNHRE